MNRHLKIFVVCASAVLVALLLIGAVRGRSASPDDTYRHLEVYTEVLSRIKSDYVEEPDLKSVTLGAVNGLLESIDPYASYLNADQYQQYLKNKDAHKAGVGLVLSKKFGYVGIVDAIPGSPAAKAGLATGDVIESINSVATRDMPLAFAEVLLEGDAGSTVELGILRARKPEPQKISLTRATVEYPAVAGKMLPEQIGLIQVASLQQNEVTEAKTQVQELQKQGAKRLILDLRHCATGGPEQGIALANLFLDKGLITYTQGQKEARHDFQADAATRISQLPMVVITDRGTAEGAEIAAAALLEDKRAEVVGERTYGDAAVRKAIKMEDGSAVILSVAKFYSPGGKAIQDTGVVPTVPVSEADAAQETDEDGAQVVEPQPKQGEDPLLKKAIQVVTNGNTELVTTQTPGKSSESPARPEGLTPLNVPVPPEK